MHWILTTIAAFSSLLLLLKTEKAINFKLTKPRHLKVEKEGWILILLFIITFVATISRELIPNQEKRDINDIKIALSNKNLFYNPETKSLDSKPPELTVEVEPYYTFNADSSLEHLHLDITNVGEGVATKVTLRLIFVGIDAASGKYYIAQHKEDQQLSDIYEKTTNKIATQGKRIKNKPPFCIFCKISYQNKQGVVQKPFKDIYYWTPDTPDRFSRINKANGTFMTTLQKAEQDLTSKELW